MSAQSSSQTSRFTAIFASGTLISRVLGLARDIMLVHVPSAQREAFLVAFRFPNMLRDIVGEGAANAAFVPVFSETLEKRSQRAFREVVASAMGAMILLLTAITIAGVWLVPELLGRINALNPITGGVPHTPEQLALTASVGRWTFPYILFIGLAVFSMAALFTVRHYFTPSWAPALLNVAMIACWFAFGHSMAEPAYALVVGVWVGGITQFAVQYAAMGRYTGVWAPSFKLNKREVATIFALLGPIVIGQAAGEVNKVVDSVFAYKSGEGAVTWLYNSNRLVQLPLTIFGFATAAAVLPAASRAAARQDLGEVRDLLMQGLRQTFFLVAPAMIGLMVIGTPVVRLLFEYGQMADPMNTTNTATALAIYAGGLLSFAWVKVAVSGFYALKDTKTPVIISSGSMLLNIFLNAILVKPYGFKGLAFATSVSYTVNFALLYILLGYRYGRLWDRAFATSLIRMSAATAVMAAVALASYTGLLRVVDGGPIVGRIVLAAGPVSAAAAAYAASSWMFGVAEVRSFASLLFRRRAKTR